jgi:alkanesulfonate monooxygenase SsuD/methylene tetrahydromethanopterin reductase-like flavin-dependent oxidoreductase (luciferase family)
MQFGTGFSLAAQEDPIALRDMAQALDEVGFDYVTTAGHLLCAPLDSYLDRPPQTYVGPFREPFVFFAYLAGVTQHLAFRTSILILPLFPTALVAKQAAELSLLSGGRFQLGVGISWNRAEYEALGQDFTTRGWRLEEQIEVIRRLWTESFVTFEGRFHSLHGVGLHQLPPHPILVWIGCWPRPLRFWRDLTTGGRIGRTGCAGHDGATDGVNRRHRCDDQRPARRWQTRGMYDEISVTA